MERKEETELEEREYKEQCEYERREYKKMLEGDDVTLVKERWGLSLISYETRVNGGDKVHLSYEIYDDGILSQRFIYIDHGEQALSLAQAFFYGILHERARNRS